MQTKKRTVVEFVAICALLLCVSACHHARTVAPITAEKAAVPAPSLAPTVTLTAEPNSIQSGSSATLSWTSQNATDVDMQPEVGKVQASGSMNAAPKDSTTYTLTATGPGGTATATARVTVMAPPAPPPPKEGDGGDLVSMSVRDVYFNFDKANIRPDAEQVLTNDAKFLGEHPSIKFTVEGQCDDRGSEEYNLALGDRRATAVKSFLANDGVSPERMDTISYGKSRPVCNEQTDECWQQNRRAHFHYGRESQ